MPAAPVEKFSGSQTCVISTEHELASTGGTNDLGTSGVFVLRLDLNALANGDTLEVRGYSKARAADTIRQEFLGVYSNVQGNPNKVSTPIPTTAYCKLTIKQTAGTGRAVPWAVIQL